MSLRKQLKGKQERMGEILDEIEGIGATAQAEDRDLSDDEMTLIADLQAESKKHEASIVTLKDAVANADRAKENRLNAEAIHVNRESHSVITGGNLLSVPAKAKGSKTKYFENEAEAYAMGKWILGLCGENASRRDAIAMGFSYENDQAGGSPSLGGATVPTPLAATIIRLVEEYGVFRRFSRNMPMSAATLDVPRRTGPLTVMYPNEGQVITGSDVTSDQVQLVAKKYAVLNIMSTELLEDAIISWTDLIATEIAWSIALAEDTNSFLGDGTGTYGGITGIANALQAGSLIAGGAGLWGGVDLGRLEQLAGMPPAYAGFQGRWYMNRYAYFTAIVSLLNAAGGTDMRQIEQGGELMLMGYPVTFTQVLPGKSGADGDLGIVFGDLALGSMLGTARNLNIRLLTELYAASDQVGMVATSRSDTVIHDVGDADNAGAIVGLTLST